MSKQEWTQRLVEAARTADLKQAEDCLQNGADINGTAGKQADGFDFYEVEGRTPLIVAASAYSRSEEMVQFLLEHKADVHQKSAATSRRKSDSALFEHICRGRKESVESLLNHGAELEGRSWVHNHTPLLAAVCGCYEKPKVVQLLLERKADIHARDEFGATAVIVCVKSLHVASLRCLLTWPGMAVNAVDNEGNTALISVINGITLFSINLSARLEVISLLLEADADTTIRNLKGQDVFDRKASVEYMIELLRSNHLDSPKVANERRQALEACFKHLVTYQKIIQEKIKRTLAIRVSSSLIESVADLVSDYDSSPPEVKVLVKLSIFRKIPAIPKIEAAPAAKVAVVAAPT